MVTLTLSTIKEPGILVDEALAKYRKDKKAGIPMTLEAAVNTILLSNMGQTISDPNNELSKTVLTLAYQRCNGNRHRRKQWQLPLKLHTPPTPPPHRQWLPYPDD